MTFDLHPRSPSTLHTESRTQARVTTGVRYQSNWHNANKSWFDGLTVGLDLSHTYCVFFALLFTDLSFHSTFFRFQSVSSVFVLATNAMSICSHPMHIHTQHTRQRWALSICHAHAHTTMGIFSGLPPSSTASSRYSLHNGTAFPLK